MGLLSRLRSTSDAPRAAPYLTASNVFERTLSSPDLYDSSLRLNELDRDSAAVITCIYLEDSITPPPEDPIKRKRRRNRNRNSKSRSGASSQSHRGSDRWPSSLQSSSSSLSTATNTQSSSQCASRTTIPPPDYKYLAPMAPRYPILPREEEGREALPAYSSSIAKSGFLYRKLELTSPFQGSASRVWAPVHFSLNNTRLDLYQAKDCIYGEDGTVTDYKIGKLVRSYTLQYAEIGLATDYPKRPFVVRMRAEQEQFLFACADEQDCVTWTHSLQMGIDLSLPLEERTMVIHRSVPRYGRRRRRSSQDSDALSNELRLSMTSTNSSTSANSIAKKSVGSSSGTLSKDSASAFNGLLSVLFPIMFRHGRRGQLRPSPPSCPDIRRRVSSSTAATINTDATATATAFINAALGLEDGDNGNANQATMVDESSGSEICTINRSNSVSQGPQEDEDSEAEYDEEDRIINDMEQCREMNSREKWNPPRKAQDINAAMRYAQRCLSSLPGNASWINKTIIAGGRKYLVRESSLIRVGYAY